jgi:hypothetical protein
MRPGAGPPMTSLKCLLLHAPVYKFSQAIQLVNLKERLSLIPVPLRIRTPVPDTLAPEGFRVLGAAVDLQPKVVLTFGC